MSDIYSVTASNIVGGPGRLVFKSFDGTYPTGIGEVMSITSPYSLVEGWKDLGATVDGIAISRGFETEDFSVDQVAGAIDTDITEWTHTLETQLAENTVDNRQLALIGGAITNVDATLGEEVTVTAESTIGATIIKLSDVSDFTVGSYVSINGTTKKVVEVRSDSIVVDTPLAVALTVDSTVQPVTELAHKRIGFGTIETVPFFTYALISQKKDGALYMAVFRKCKVTGDDKEQTFGKEKRLLPLQLAAYPDENQPQEENVYFEIEQVL